MALTDFTTAQALRDVILDMSTDRMDKILQKFTLRENDISIINGFWNQRELFASPEDIAAIENVRTSGQNVTVNLYGRKAPGTTTQRQRESTDGQTVFNFTPTYFDPIVEGFQVSEVNNAIRQFMNEGAPASEAVRMAVQNEVMFGMSQAIKNIYVRANAQYRDFLEANKWALNTTPDAGTQYTTYLGDAKRVPLADTTNFFQKLQIELEQNNFLMLAAQDPNVFMSTPGKQVVNDYLKSGPQNAENLTQFLGYFNAFSSNVFVDNAGVGATFYAVAPGGICGYQRAFDYAGGDPESVNGVSTYGEDSWSMMEVGGEDTLFFPGAPRLRLELKRKRGYENNVSTLTVDEARIDIAKSWVLTATFGGSKAPTTATEILTADASPIIKYEILNS